MRHLEEEHPEAFEYLKSGGVSVQIGEGNNFGKVLVRQVCGETVNKDAHGRGTKGFSLKAGGVNKYYLVAEYRTIFLRLMNDILDLNKSNFHHTDLQSTRIVIDETDVKSLVAMLQSHSLDPFSSVQQDLLCLSARKVVPPKIQQDLLASKAVGEKAYEIFRVQRLDSQPPQTKLHDTIPKAKLQTFTDLNKVKSRTSKEIILKADRNLFSQMILIAGPFPGS